MARSEIGSCSFENWSRWNYISRAESPRPRILELSCAVAIARLIHDTGPPHGSCRSSSSSTSNTAFSATRFLFGFLMRPTSKQMPGRFNVGSSTSAIKPGSGSTRMTAGGPSRGRNSRQRRTMQSRKASWRSDSTTLVDV